MSDIRMCAIFLLVSSKNIKIFDEKNRFNLNFINNFGVSSKNHKKNIISTSKLENSIEYIVVPSWNNPRWFIPNNRRIICNTGSIIKPTSIKARFVWSFALLLNKFGLFSLVFNNKVYIKTETIGAFFLKNINKDNQYIIYTGAKGVFQKFTVQEMNSNCEIKCFYKIGTSKLSRDRIKFEYNVLNYLKQNKLLSFKHPNVLDFYELNNISILKQSPSPSICSEVKLILTTQHYAFFEELHLNCINELSLGSYLLKLNNKKKYSEWMKIDDVNILNDTYDIIKSKLSTISKLRLTFSHGDFTPWNILCSNKEIFVYDWEMGDYRFPLWDYFNFIYHKNILINGFDFNVIVKEIYNNKLWILKLLSGYEKIDINICHTVYLFDIISHYTEQYILMIENDIVDKHNIENLIITFKKALTLLNSNQ